MSSLVADVCGLGQFLKVRLLDGTLAGSSDQISLPSNDFLTGQFGLAASGMIEAIAPLRPVFGEGPITVVSVCCRSGGDKNGFVMVPDLDGNNRRVHASCFIPAKKGD